MEVCVPTKYLRDFFQSKENLRETTDATREIVAKNILFFKSYIEDRSCEVLNSINLVELGWDGQVDSHSSMLTYLNSVNAQLHKTCYNKFSDDRTKKRPSDSGAVIFCSEFKKS